MVVILLFSILRIQETVFLLKKFLTLVILFTYTTTDIETIVKKKQK